MTDIKDSITSVGNRYFSKVKAHSPEIMVGVGIVGAIGAAVLACRATLKVNDILENAKTDIDSIHSVQEDEEISEETYSDKDAQKDLFIVYSKTAFELAKIYAPSVILGVASIACILQGHHILKGRNAALAAAYTLVDKGYREYRIRVVERFGEEIDNELRYGVESEIVTVKEIDADGKNKKVKKTVDVIKEESSIYARCFDEFCPSWTTDPLKNKATLESYQHWFNDVLFTNGFIFLNDVYDAFGFPRIPAGQVIGWSLKYPDSKQKVELILKKFYNDANDFVNGYEPSVWIDFDPDGPILDYM